MSDTPVSPDATLALVKGVVIPFLFKLAGAIALWIVGGWLIGFAIKFLRRMLHANGRLDATVISYLINILDGLLRIVLVVAILGFFGIQTASFAALLAGAGVAVGVAWGGCSRILLRVFSLLFCVQSTTVILLRWLALQAQCRKWGCSYPR